MGKRYLALLLVLLTALWGSGAARAEDGDYDWIRLQWDGSSWAVPEGTEVLSHLECDPWVIDSLRLPSSLRRMLPESLYGYSGSSLHIPEGMEEMEGWCLNYSAVCRVTLPSTLRVFDGSSLAGAESVRHVRVAEDNPYFMVQDDVIFTKDGTTLVYYPPDKRDLHYDVPRGVTTIGTYAFRGNDWLVTLSLPMGLTAIERGGIEDCGRLEAVSLPLSLERMGDWCFSDCVSLERVQMPDGVEMGERCFDNCPLLSGREKVGEPERASERDWYWTWRDGLISPVNAGDRVPIYSQPDEGSSVLFRSACGSSVTVWEELDGFTKVGFYSDRYSESMETGYVRSDQLVWTDAWEPLFTIMRVVPRQELKGSLREMRALPTEMQTTVWPQGAKTFRVREVTGQWLEGYWMGMVVEDGEMWVSCLDGFPALWLGDLKACYRTWTGDDRTLGMVVSDAPGNRVNLREKPDRSAHHLAKYFSGTQLEVLGEQGDWYQVRMVDGTEGWMMKDYVMVVEQEAF